MNHAGIGLASSSNYTYSPFLCFPLTKDSPLIVRCICAL